MLIQKLLTRMPASGLGIRVIDAVPDRIAARQRIKATNPGVLMALRPMPLVQVSWLTRKGADATPAKPGAGPG